MAHITEKWWTLQEKSFFYHSAIVVKQSSNGSDSGPEQKKKVTLMDILQWQYFKQTLLLSRITKQFLQNLNWCSQSRKRQKSGLKKWALFFSCSFFQAFNYSGHSVKNGQRKYKEVQRESPFAFQHHTSTLFLLSGLTCAPTYRTSERDYFPRWRFCGKLPVVKYPASRVSFDLSRSKETLLAGYM